MRECGWRNKKRQFIRMMEIVILMSLLIACSRSEDTAMSSTDPSSEVTQSAALTAAPTITPTPVPKMLYKGDGSKYEYTMTDERDRAWEEDIVYFADRYLDPLGGHPKLIDRGCEIGYMIDIRNGFEELDVKYESLLNVEMREAFIAKINSLLLSISEKSDFELHCGCAEAAAILEDAHSCVWAFPDPEEALFFPLELMPIYTDGEPNAYIVAAPEGMENLLLCRIDAINDIPLSAIIEKYGRLISHESMTWVQEMFFYYWDFRLTLNYDLLFYLGVVDESKTALFSLTDEDGTAWELELSCVQDDETLKMVDYQVLTEQDEAISRKLRSSNPDKTTWYSFLEDGTVLYIRAWRCTTDMDKPINEAVWAAEKTGSVKKVILDFRNNGGGYDTAAGEIIKRIHSLDAEEGKYVLINGGSFSGAVSISTFIRRFGGDVLLVGSPAGQPPNGFFPRGVFVTPNGKLEVWLAANYCYYCWPDNDDPALMPDITVFQTLEDYKNGIDTVMKYLLRDSEE